MHTIFLLLLMLASLCLAACSATGTPGQATIIVVTATPQALAPVTGQESGGQAAPALATATTPAQNVPAATPTNTAAPSNNAPPAASATNTLPPAAPANPTASGQLPAAGLAATVSVDQVMHYVAVDPNGNPLGEVKDLVIVRNAAAGGQGEISYVVVDSNLRDDWRIPIPWKNVQLRPDLQAVVLPVTADRLLMAPGFNKDFWPASFSAQQAALQNFWANPAQAAAPAAPLAQGLAGKQYAEYIRADDLLSMDILSPQGVKLGKIKDAALDAKNSQPGSANAGQFSYVVLEVDDKVNPAEPMVPIPWRLIRAMPGQENVIVNLAPALLLTAPNFPKGLLPDLYSEPLSTQLNQFWSNR